jgi:hypothetical protein
MLRTAATPIGHIHVMDFVPGILQAHQRPGHEELNVIRMRGDGEGGFGHF